MCEPIKIFFYHRHQGRVFSGFGTLEELQRLWEYFKEAPSPRTQMRDLSQESP
jgi:hypothetical protein